jgi:hypothetical protein
VIQYLVMEHIVVLGHLVSTLGLMQQKHTMVFLRDKIMALGNKVFDLLYVGQIFVKHL